MWAELLGRAGEILTAFTGFSGVKLLLALVLGEIGVVNELIVGEEKLLIMGSTGLWLSKLIMLLVHWETAWKYLSWPKLSGCKKEELEEEREREKKM